ncbi:MAG: hypothetical protein R3C02_21095 [Planctomycetaceae bacterium]
MGTTALSRRRLRQTELDPPAGGRLILARDSRVCRRAAPERRSRVGIGRKGKGTLLLLTDANDIPLACHIAAANESEVNLIEPLLDRSVVDEAFWPSTHLLYDERLTATRCAAG